MYFDTLLGKEIDGIIVTEAHIKMSERKLAGQRLTKLRNEKHPDARQTLDYIIAHYLTADEVLKNIPSIKGLVKRNQDRDNGELPQKIKEVKFDDVRNMDLSLSNWDTYTDSERKLAQELLKSYNEYYDLEAPNDKTGILDIVDLEVRMQTIRIFIRVAKLKKEEIKEYDTQLKELRVQWSKALDDLNLKKKQRDNTKIKPNDQNIDLTTAINQLDKSISDMQAEIEADKKQEKDMINKLSKKTKKDLEDLF